MGLPTITMAILAKDKARVLPLYLRCLEALDYPKDRISLFVRTNDNTDGTEAILRSWLDRHGAAYAAVAFRAASLDPGLRDLGVHEWTRRRFVVLNQLREQALRAALTWGTDFFFVADCDNWILPHTLRRLVEADRPIVAPFLRHTDPARPYSNYHCRVTADGWFQDCDEQGAVWRQERRGLIEVACVHCTYLVRADAIPRLAYEDGSDRYDYVVFSESARRAGIPQCLDNREVYGWLNMDEDPTAAARLVAAATSAPAPLEPLARLPTAARGPRTRASARGSRLATVLEGAWRPEPADPALSVEDLAEITPLMLSRGEGALAWWRLRGGRLADSAPAHTLRQALRRQAVQALVHERRIEAAVASLRQAGIEPVLGKGWAVARLYPDPALRPSGDIDLFVPAGAHGAAASHPLPAEVDLHRGFAELDDFPARDVLARSRLEAIGAGEVRVFGEEDHLRLLCLHMLRHGACRPLWLCDVAVALERRSGRFDWDVFLGGDARRADRAVCALGLSHALLGARLDGVPPVVSRRMLPAWMVPTVLRQWGAEDFVPHGRRTPIDRYLRAPHAWPRAVRGRWPNGIEATVGVGGPFNELPRLPFQIADGVRRTVRFVGRLR